MISFEVLKRTTKKVEPVKETKESYLSWVESRIKLDFEEGKRFSKIDCKNEVFDGHALKKLLKEQGYNVELHKKYDNYYGIIVPDYVLVNFV
jgi:hypothetical protein